MRTFALRRITGSLVAVSLLLSATGAVSIETAFANHSQCSDGRDDDGDGKIDFPADNECDSLDDDNEAPNEDVFVSVTDNRDTVSAGEPLIYVISLKQQRENVKLIDVALHVPAQNSIVSVSDDGSTQDGSVRWRKVAVFRGETRRLSVHVVVSPDVAGAQLLIARVLADGSEATDTTAVNGRPIPYPDNQLEVSITDHRDTAGPGDVLDYDVAVRNPEPNATVVHVRVKIPTALRLLSSPGADIVNDELIWRDIALSARAERLFSFRAVVDDRAPRGYPIQVTARAGNVVAYDRTSTGGSPYSLFSTITDNRETALRGDLLTYVIHIDNTSGRLDPHANIDAAIPMYSEFVSATEGGVRDRENIRWLDMSVAPNGTRDLRFTVRVRDDAPDNTQLRATATVQGQVSSDITRVTNDGYTSYRDANENRLYAGPLEVEKSSDRTSATAGSSIEYTVSVRNDNNREIRDIAVEDVYSPSEFTVTDPGSGDDRDGRIQWSIDSLQPGERRVFRYQGTLARSLRPGYAVLNTARAFASAVDIGSSPYTTGDDYGYHDENNYAYLPQTGIGDFFAPIENTGEFLSPVRTAAEGNGLPLLIWLTVIAAGMAGGAGLGKKYSA